MTKMKLSNWVADQLVAHGVRDVFMLTGGGAMHLNHSIGTHPDLKTTFCHHEQALAMAGEAYYRLTNRLAVVNVTSGPGGTNAITGVYGGFVDSVGMLVISGQVKIETTVRYTGLPLRQYGDQELDIEPIVMSITKYVTMVTNPRSFRYHLEKTIHLTSTGQVVGTAAYLSPEQVRGKPIGPATDVYALGLLAIEALTGRIAFPGGPAESAAARLVRGPDLPRALDRSWRTVLTAMTATDPLDRPPVGVLQDLVARLPDETESSAPTDLETQQLIVVAQAQPTAVMPAMIATPRERRRPRRHLLAVACLLLALVAAGGWFAALTGGSGPKAVADTTVASAPVAKATDRPSPSASTTPRAVAATPKPIASLAAPVVVPTPAAAVTDRSKLDQRTKQWLDHLRERLRGHHPHR